MPLASSSERSVLLDQLQRGFHGGAWHGSALAEVLAGVDAAEARWRPAGGSHSIAELVGHLAFWIDDASRVLRAEPRIEPTAEADWGGGRAATVAEWRRTLDALDTAHRRLAAALEGLEEARLDQPVPGSDPTLRGLLLGLLQHNAYHTGQAALVRRQARAAGGAP